MAIIISGGRATRVRSSPVARLREAITDVRREIEDLSWNNLSAPDERASGLEDDSHTRNERLRDIRIIRRRNPLAKNAAGLLQHYVLGQGVSIRPNNKSLVARIVDEFWDDPVNKVTFTGHQAMKEQIDTVWTDGELFLVLYPDVENGTVTLGHIDTMNVDDIILDTDNRKIARWYKVKTQRRKFNFQTDRYEEEAETEFVYYRDWRNPEDADEEGENRAPASEQPPASKIKEGLVYHVAVNKRGKRGESELAAARDWIKQHKKFMENRATINEAAASIAWKKKRKGPASDIAAEVQRIASGLSASGNGYDNNPPPAPGSTVVENENSTLEWVKTDTGGAQALSDERILRMMTGAGMGGIPNHYQGDEAAANLATATAMELPLLKTYEDWQALWADVIRDLLQFVLETAHAAERIGERDDTNRYTDVETTPQDVLAQNADEAGQGPPAVKVPMAEANAIKGDLTMVPREMTATGVPVEPTEPEEPDTTVPVDWYIDVDFPPIVQKDLTTWVSAMNALYTILPGSNIESQKLVIEMFLTALGTNDVDQVMARLFPPSMAAVPSEDVVAQQTDMIAGRVAELLMQGAMPPEEAGAAMDAMAESDDLTPLARYRVRRLLREARRSLDVADDAAVGG